MTENEARGRPATVLFIEDSPSDVLMTREALDQAKVQIDLHVLDNGIDALSFLRREDRYLTAPRPDLILLDLNLPRKDGREVLREIKSDEALKRIPVVVLTSSSAEEDTLARISGDEFTVLLEDIGAAREAAGTARRLLQSLAAPVRLDHQEITIGASLGISVCPADGADLSTLMKDADTAMYRAKREGKNTYRFFTEGMNREAMERLLIETGLRRAIERAELCLHYQPIVDLASAKTVGAEALVRWRHPETGLIPPARFVPIAEECGLIGALDNWVLKEACRAAQTWPEDLRVAVNISPRHFRDRHLARTIEEGIERAGLPTNRLEIELTEGAVMEDPAAAAEVLRGLKALGVRVAIDDFGTGYSSLGYLKRFPIDRLKIDRSFIQEITTDGDAAAITTAVIALAHSLEMKVTAEGVETAEQLAALKAQGCDEAQGYYFGDGGETMGGATRSRNASGLVGAAAQ